MICHCLLGHYNRSTFICVPHAFREPSRSNLTLTDFVYLERRKYYILNIYIGHSSNPIHFRKPACSCSFPGNRVSPRNPIGLPKSGSDSAVGTSHRNFPRFRRRVFAAEASANTLGFAVRRASGNRASLYLLAHPRPRLCGCTFSWLSVNNIVSSSVEEKYNCLQPRLCIIAVRVNL